MPASQEERDEREARREARRAARQPAGALVISGIVLAVIIFLAVAGIIVARVH